MAKIDIIGEMTGSIWKILAEPGQQVTEGDTVILIEAMKMEIPVAAPESGRVSEILVKEGDMVADGDVVMRLEQ
ncbi:biotin/lipoyl-binding carrier protein [Arvimicrobium flavum]|uniref:biotin/lipoyl-binding carrier protein n=1 Tax=Arvimicrobium flavum TaxID=3393320 RepID=UPI00237C287A|nr:biotin/lipoyl-binding carrier protein [Mesorhizobium shangrilense]